jgi:tetratricopeptide (TPR) repeat protein
VPAGGRASRPLAGPGFEARLASAYVQTGRHERARQLFLRELRRDPGDIDTLLDLGDLLFDMNRLAEAREKYSRVLELEPDNADAHASLGELYAHAGAENDAITEFDLVVRLDPSDGVSARRLAGLLLSRGHDEDLVRARRLIESQMRRLRVEPASLNADALHDLGCLLLDAGRAGDATRVFARLTDLAPGDSQAWHRASVSHFEAGRVEEGLAASRRALRLNPRSVAVMHNLAVAHLRSGQIARARYWIRQALAVEPDDQPIRRLRAVLLAHACRRGVSGIGSLAIWLPRFVASLVRRPARRRTA